MRGNYDLICLYRAFVCFCKAFSELEHLCVLEDPYPRKQRRDKFQRVKLRLIRKFDGSRDRERQGEIYGSLCPKAYARESLKLFFNHVRIVQRVGKRRFFGEFTVSFVRKTSVSIKRILVRLKVKPRLFFAEAFNKRMIYQSVLRCYFGCRIFSNAAA